jgi:hypothetical protein
VCVFRTGEAVKLTGGERCSGKFRLLVAMLAFFHAETRKVVKVCVIGRG